MKCLTCSDCNKSAGRFLDQAVAMRYKAIRDRQAGRGTKVEIDICGSKHTTYLSPSGVRKSQLDSRLASNPNVKCFLDKMESKGQKTVLLAEMTRGPNWDVSKGLTLSTKMPSTHQVAVSWLRSAYLQVFCLLGPAGYGFAKSEAIEPIRQQIMNPEEELVPSLLCDISRSNMPKQLILVNKWQRPFCWVVKIEDHGILLPHGGSADHYREVQELHDIIIPKGFIGWYPIKFGSSESFDLTLRKNSHHLGRDLFGQEITISNDDFERKCMVVNQQGLLGTYLPSSRVVRRDKR